MKVLTADDMNFLVEAIGRITDLNNFAIGNGFNIGSVEIQDDDGNKVGSLVWESIEDGYAFT